MNAEAKKKWVEALRSGKYRQVHGTLFSGVNDGTVMCCALGVLNDVSGLGEWRTEFYVVEDYEDTDLEYIDEEAWQEVVAFSREGHKLRQFMERGGEVRLPLAAELEQNGPAVSAGKRSISTRLWRSGQGSPNKTPNSSWMASPEPSLISMMELGTGEVPRVGGPSRS